MAVRFIPDGYQSVTPYLIVDDARAALAYYEEAFGAQELLRLDGPGGSVGHAEIRIGDSRVMLASEFPEMDALAPKSVGGTPVSLLVYTEDVDATFARAIAAGGTVLRAVADQFYGDRSGTLRDPFGHKWTLSTHIEEVAPDELKRRADSLFGQADGASA